MNFYKLTMYIIYKFNANISFIEIKINKKYWHFFCQYFNYSLIFFPLQINY